MKHYKAPNKRIISRGGNGRFRKTSMQDFGIGGTCPECRHLLIQHYDGDPRDEFPNPRNFRYRCFTCEPLTDAEIKLKAEIEAAKPKTKSLFEILEDSIKSHEENVQ